MSKTAQKIRAERQESLRELLSNQGHIQHVIDLATKIEAIGETLEKGVSIDSAGKEKDIGGLDVQRLAIAIKAKKDVIDTKMKLINKYLGDVKSVEHSGDVTQTVVSDRNKLEELLRAKGIEPENLKIH